MVVAVGPTHPRTGAGAGGPTQTADRPPHPLGVSGMSRWRTPKGASASITALCTAGVEPMRAGLADALGARAGSPAWASPWARARSVGQLGGRDDGVVGEVRRDAGCRRRRSGPPRSSAWATPWAMPPWRWPSTISGLRMRPASSQVTIAPQPVPGRSRCRPRPRRRGRRTGRWRLLGGEGRLDRQPGQRPSPSGSAMSPAAPTSAHVRLTDGVPATWNTPGSVSSTTSSGRGLEQLGRHLAGPSRRPPRWRSHTAEPPSCSEREPEGAVALGHQVGVAGDDVDLGPSGCR